MNGETRISLFDVLTVANYHINYVLHIVLVKWNHISKVNHDDNIKQRKFEKEKKTKNIHKVQKFQEALTCADCRTNQAA